MLDVLDQLDVTKESIQLIKYCQIILNQLIFVETFTEDLLNINMI